MFTCPFHQWASHELPCPACQKSQSFTTSDIGDYANFIAATTPAAPPDVEEQYELWRHIFCFEVTDIKYLMAHYTLTKNK